MGKDNKDLWMYEWACLDGQLVTGMYVVDESEEIRLIDVKKGELAFSQDVYGNILVTATPQPGVHSESLTLYTRITKVIPIQATESFWITEVELAFESHQVCLGITPGTFSITDEQLNAKEPSLLKFGYYFLGILFTFGFFLFLGGSLSLPGFLGGIVVWTGLFAWAIKFTQYRNKYVIER